MYRATRLRKCEAFSKCLFVHDLFRGVFFYLSQKGADFSLRFKLRIYDFLAYSAVWFLYATQPAWIRHPWLSHAFRRRPVCELLEAWQNMRKSIHPTQAAPRKVCAFLRGFKRKRPENMGRKNRSMLARGFSDGYGKLGGECGTFN